MKKSTFFLIIICFVSLFLSCVNKEKLKEEAYQKGLKIGKELRYTDFVNEYYSDSTILKLNGEKYTHNIDINKQVENLRNQTHEDFQNVVYELNKDILKGLSLKLKLNKVQEKEVFEIYNKSHLSISDEYYSQYIELCNKKELNRSPNEFIQYTYYDRTEALAEVMGNQMCSTIGFIIGTLNLKYPSGNIAGIMAGAPCVTVSTQLLKPITDELIESGFIKDIATSKTIIERKLSNMIIELASIEKQYNIQLNIRNEVKTFWGAFTSTADITTEYYGIVKAGYNLGNTLQLQIDYKNQKILLVIGEAKIFTPVVYPKIKNMENGWFAKIDKSTLNGMQIRATNQIISTAINDNIILEAEQNAKLFLQNIFNPIARIPPKPFTVEIVSQKNAHNIKNVEL